MLTSDNTFGDLCDLCDTIEKNSCLYKEFPKAKDDFALNIIEGIRKYGKQEWAYWILDNIKDIENDIRKILFEFIECPMVAFQIYIHSEQLSDDEDEILKSKFEGKLSNAEKQLKDRVIIRAKDA